MEHVAEEEAPPKPSMDPKPPEIDGQETVIQKETTRQATRGAKKPLAKAGSSHQAKEADKEEAMSKGPDRRRKPSTSRLHRSSKSRETADHRRPHDTASSSTTTKHNTVPTIEAAAGVPPLSPGTMDSKERATPTDGGTTDHKSSEVGTNRDQMPTNQGMDERKVPPDDPLSAADATTFVTSIPAKTTAGSEIDHTRVVSSSDIRSAVVARSSSGSGATAVRTQQTATTGPESEPVTRLIGTAVGPKQECTDRAVEPAQDIVRTRRMSYSARWVTRTSRPKDMTKPVEVPNLSTRVPRRIPAQCYAVIVFGSLVLLTLVAYLMSRTGSKKFHYDTCKTLACVQFSKRLVESINRSARPCDSFDQYVCDGWRKSHDLSVQEDSFQSILARLYRDVRDLDVPKKGQNAKERAAAFYRSCECVGKGECDELPAVRSWLTRAGVVWPRRVTTRVDALTTLLYTSVRLRWGAILAFEFSSVAGERHVFLRTAEELNLLKWKLNENRVSASNSKHYYEVLRDSFADGAREAANASGRKVFVTYEETQQLESTMLWPFFQLAPAKVTETIADRVMYKTVPTLTPKRWASALRDYLQLLDAKGPIVFRTDAGNVVLQLLELWRDHGENAVHLLLSWCAVQVAALFANQQLIRNFYGSRGIAEVAHGVSCFSKAFRIVGEQALYGSSEKFLPSKMRFSAQRMVVSVRKTFRGRLQRWKHYNESVTVVQDWNSTAVVLKYFDEAAQNKSNRSAQAGDSSSKRIGKIDMGDSLAKNWAVAAVASIVDPSSLRLSEDIEDMDMYTLIQSGANSPDFSLLPYAFVFPYFDEGATLAMNYAGVGRHMAEALSLLFLDAYDTQVESATALTDHFVCMEGNASDILGRRGWARRMEPVSLKVALDAYHAAESEGRSDRRLEGLEFLSPEQLFFAAACFTRCAGTGTTSALRREAQCDAAFRHLDEFSDAFECPEGSPLNPANKCHLL